MKKREKKGHDLSLAAVALLSAAALGAAALNLPRAAGGAERRNPTAAADGLGQRRQHAGL